MVDFDKTLKVYSLGGNIVLFTFETQLRLSGNQNYPFASEAGIIITKQASILFWDVKKHLW